MKLRNLLGWSSALCLSAAMVQAQETNQTERFEQKLKEIEQSFEKRQQEMRDSFERMMRDQKAEIDALKKELASRTNPPPSRAVTPEQLKEVDEKVTQVAEAQKKVRPGEFNPAIGLVGETVFGYRTKG